MAAGSFHVLHITKRALAAPKPRYRPRDPEPGLFPGQKPPNPEKPSSYITSYVDPRTKHHHHYKNGGCWRY